VTIQKTRLINISLFERSIVLWFAIFELSDIICDVIFNAINLSWILLYQSMRKIIRIKLNNVDSFIIYFFFISFFIFIQNKLYSANV